MHVQQEAGQLIQNRLSSRHIFVGKGVDMDKGCSVCKRRGCVEDEHQFVFAYSEYSHVRVKNVDFFQHYGAI